MFDKKKFNPKPKVPDDTVDTIYCSETSDEFKDISRMDMFPYANPLPKYRREPEPPII